jgi:hypothetical protein
VASALNCPEARDGVVVVGSAVGKATFVASFAKERTKAVEDLVDKLAELPLRHQDRFVLLGKSMVPWLVHLVRTAPLGAETRWTKKWPSQRSLFRWADFRASPTAEVQLNLPLRFGGLGLRLPGSGGGEGRVARLSSIMLQQQALSRSAA